MKSNEWLINTNFVVKIKYHNKMYINKLFKRVYDLLKEFPVPIISSYDPKGGQIYFMFVDHKKSFIIDDNIDIEDYATLVTRWCSQFFPSYTVKTTKTIPLDKDEVFKKVKEEKIPIEEAVDLTKEIEVVETGIIKSIYLTDDLFRIDVNDESFIAHSNKMRLTDFKEQLKDISSDEEKREFIFSNSVEVTDQDKLDIIFSKAPYFRNNTIKDRIIKFTGKKMWNFFSINYPDLKSITIEKISELLYQWGNYKIYFENEEMEKDCLEYIQKKREQDNISFNVA